LDELAQELRRSALSNDLGSGTGFHVNPLSGDAQWLSGHADRAGGAELFTGQLKIFCQFIHLQVYKLTNAILASIY
jgi:hypothetical protein